MTGIQNIAIILLLHNFEGRFDNGLRRDVRVSTPFSTSSLNNTLPQMSLLSRSVFF